MHKIIGVCDVCFKDGDPVEIDAILNSIVSIMVTVSSSFCVRSIHRSRLTVLIFRVNCTDSE